MLPETNTRELAEKVVDGLLLEFNMHDGAQAILKKLMAAAYIRGRAHAYQDSIELLNGFKKETRQ